MENDWDIDRSNPVDHLIHTLKQMNVKEIIVVRTEEFRKNFENNISSNALEEGELNFLFQIRLDAIHVQFLDIFRAISVSTDQDPTIEASPTHSNQKMEETIKLN